MRDFSCADPDEMYFEILRDTVRYYKEDPKGVEVMCEAFEETRREGIEYGIEYGIQMGISQGIEQGRELSLVNSIRNVMDAFGVTVEKAMETLRIPEEQYAYYRRKLSE